MRCSQLVLLAIAIVSCTTPPKPPEPTPTEQTEATTIDMLGLQRSLGLERPETELGYEEKTFDTCAVGYGYSSTHQCQKQNFVVLNFRLQCRDSEGTVQGVSKAELSAVVSDKVKWNFGKLEGFTKTNGEGFGQVRLISPVSLRERQIRITINGRFLAVSADELRRIVVPRNWCRIN